MQVQVGPRAERFTGWFRRALGDLRRTRPSSFSPRMHRTGVAARKKDGQRDRCGANPPNGRASRCCDTWERRMVKEAGVKELIRLIRESVQSGINKPVSIAVKMCLIGASLGDPRRYTPHHGRNPQANRGFGCCIPRGPRCHRRGSRHLSNDEADRTSIRPTTSDPVESRRSGETLRDRSNGRAKGDHPYRRSPSNGRQS